MSKGIMHRIIYQPDGESFAFDIEDFFTNRFNLQFELNDLETVNSKGVSSLGVSILLLTSESYECIRCGKRSDLKELFPNPDFSIALLYSINKSHHEITQMLAPRTRNFNKWTILEYQSHNQFISLCKDIMALVVTLEGQTFLTPPLQSVRVWPRDGVKAYQQLLIIFNDPVDEKADVSVIQMWDNVKRETQRFNAINYSFTVGDVVAGQIKLAVFVNEAIYGKAMLHVLHGDSKMEQISKLVHDAINPVELLCQTLSLDSSNRDDLDRELIDLMPDNVSPLDKVFNRLDWANFGEPNSNHELPTLVHFGAKFGLLHFCMQLLKFPGGKQALQIKNKNGLLPYEIADEEKFKDLAFALQTAGDCGNAIPLGQYPTYAKERYSEILQRKGPYHGQTTRDSGISDGMSENGTAHENEQHWRYRSMPPSYRFSSRRETLWKKIRPYEEINSLDIKE
ncbi:hypothetical protein CHS0354_024945 [Potamilus streckersoni]|uniref:DBB domain-containing protein n=1 Tax=Potamilus streckersoni TaxID=2493646 RepID=A0AAE0SQH0_9BIVA|nr:hypothetical protein CHS0354_024945 [Potamilus streckersoni]